MENDRTENSVRVAVVGGGLVGSLSACYFAQRGFNVDLYELREDIRISEHVKGRSINLALSFRGLSALREVGLEKEVLNTAIPMYARMIHDRNGRRRPIPYGTKDQCIYSVGRRSLNQILLQEAEKHDKVNFFFEHKLISADLTKPKMTFRKPDHSTFEASADLLVATDGAFSTARKEMLKQPHFNFQQKYIEHGYLELTMPPNEKGDFAMETNYLHIWARDGFMMIALPNQDRSFTVTLFMPFPMFESIRTDQDLVEFFEKNFKDAIQLIGKEQLVKDFFGSKPSFLLYVKCSPYNVGSTSVLLGDSAHAMVPFYGQGMNCGFEDCLILNKLLTENNNNLGKTLAEYSKFRSPDAEAIVDLALYNYVEMRHLVNSSWFIFRKKLDGFLFKLMPSKWMPLYSMVTFSRTRYHVCIEKKAWQDRVIKKSFYILLGAITVTSGLTAYYMAPSTLTKINLPNFNIPWNFFR